MFNIQGCSSLDNLTPVLRIIFPCGARAMLHLPGSFTVLHSRMLAPCGGDKINLFRKIISFLIAIKIILLLFRSESNKQNTK